MLSARLKATPDGQIVGGSSVNSSEDLAIRLGNADAELSWHIHKVNSDALQSGLAFVSKLPPITPLTLRFHTDEWTMEERFTHASEAVARVDEIVKTLGANVTSLSPYKLTQLSPDNQDKETLLSQVFKSWDQRQGTIDAGFLEDLDTLGILDRAIIMRVADDGGLIYKFIGLGHAKRFGSDWPVSAIGTRYDQGQPDDKYTKWINSQYRDALKAGPRRDILDTVIDCAGAPPTRVQYDRGLLPCSFESGTPALLSISEVRPGLAPLLP